MTTIQNLKIADLKPYLGNPRDNDGAVPGVVASIEPLEHSLWLFGS